MLIAVFITEMVILHKYVIIIIIIIIIILFLPQKPRGMKSLIQRAWGCYSLASKDVEDLFDTIDPLKSFYGRYFG